MLVVLVNTPFVPQGVPPQVLLRVGHPEFVQSLQKQRLTLDTPG